MVVSSPGMSAPRTRGGDGVTRAGLEVDRRLPAALLGDAARVAHARVEAGARRGVSLLGELHVETRALYERLGRLAGGAADAGADVVDAARGAALSDGEQGVARIAD